MTTLSEIKIENLKAFENNPFIFREDTAFEMLIDSISNLGVLTPIIVRSLDDGTMKSSAGTEEPKLAEGSALKQSLALLKN